MTAPDPDLSPANYPAEPEPVDLDEITPEPCGCCGWHDWWRNPNCVQSQPPEFVIDDAQPGVLRAPRPDDFARPGTLPRRRPPRGPALLAHAGRAVANRLCAWCDLPATVLIDGGGWDDPACQRHAERWGDGRATRPIGGDTMSNSKTRVAYFGGTLVSVHADDCRCGECKPLRYWPEHVSERLHRPGGLLDPARRRDG